MDTGARKAPMCDDGELAAVGCSRVLRPLGTHVSTSERSVLLVRRCFHGRLPTGSVTSVRCEVSCASVSRTESYRCGAGEGTKRGRKPSCQLDCALKFGFAFKSSCDFLLMGTSYKTPLPLTLQGDLARERTRRYIDFCCYMHYLMDLQLRRILQALDDNNLTDSAIVVFLSDLGEMAGAHGGRIQKFHSAYEEIVRVPMVISSPLVNDDRWSMREVHRPTSSVDLAPTLLGLAGLNQAELREPLSQQRGAAAVQPLPGADLSSQVTGRSKGPILGPDGMPRSGVFFLTDDEATELSEVDPGEAKTVQYDAFLVRVC